MRRHIDADDEMRGIPREEDRRTYNDVLPEEHIEIEYGD